MQGVLFKGEMQGVGWGGRHCSKDLETISQEECSHWGLQGGKQVPRHCKQLTAAAGVGQHKNLQQSRILLYSGREWSGLCLRQRLMDEYCSRLRLAKEYP